MLPRRYQLSCGLIFFFLFILYAIPQPDRIRDAVIDQQTGNEKDFSTRPAAEDNGRVPITETSLATTAHTPGFTIFDQLFLRNKTFYVVTSSPETFPPISYIISQPSDKKAGLNIDPTGQVSTC